MFDSNLDKTTSDRNRREYNGIAIFRREKKMFTRGTALLLAPYHCELVTYHKTVQIVISLPLPRRIGAKKPSARGPQRPSSGLALVTDG
jgi:hypothetical protein